MKNNFKTKNIILSIIQILLITAGTYYLMMFVIPVFGIIFNIGSILGTFLSLAVVLTGIFLKKIIKFCKVHYKNKKGKIILNTVFSVIGAGLLCFSLVLGSIITSASTNAQGQSTVIILGCSVIGDNPSVMLRSRINAAYDYMTENPDSVAVLSGGQGAGESITEAQCMFNVLTEMGIEKSRLYLEDKSRNTAENIIFSKKIIEENNLSKDVAVATSDYHLKRAAMICKENGLNPSRICAQSTFWDKPTFYLREVLGVVKEFIF